MQVLSKFQIVMAEPDPTVPPTEPVAEVYPPLPAEQQPSEQLQPPVQPEPIAQPPPQVQAELLPILNIKYNTHCSAMWYSTRLRLMCVFNIHMYICMHMTVCMQL